MNSPIPRAVLFAGQGAQKIGMGADLVEKSPCARELYELADNRLGWPVSDYSFRGPAEALVQTGDLPASALRSWPGTSGRVSGCDGAAAGF